MRIKVFAVIMVLIRTKYGCMGIGLYCIFGNGRKSTKRSPPDNLTQWIITQSKVFTGKGIGKISRFVRAGPG